MTISKTDARYAYVEYKNEAIRLCEAVAAKLHDTNGLDRRLNWGDVGSMAELVNQLKNAGHWAGVEGCVEK